MQTAGFNLRLKTELYTVLHSFQEHGVRAVPFKGPTLTKSVYGNIALRQFGDLDILIDRQQFVRAHDLLLELGYEQTDLPAPVRPAEFQRIQVDTTFTHAKKGVVIELHWQLISPYWSQSKIPSDPWMYVVPATFGSSEIEVFQDEFMFVYLCFHGYKHSWERLAWLVDISELMSNRPRLDWQKIAVLADKFAIADIVDAGILLASEILGVDVPEDVAQRLRSKRHLMQVVPFVEKIQFPAPESFETTNFRTDTNFLFHMMLATPQQKYQLLVSRYLTRLDLKPNQADREWIRLPRRLNFLYYLVRPIRLVYQLGAEQLKLIRSLRGPSRQ